jgi:hydrogenase maturation protease
MPSAPRTLVVGLGNLLLGDEGVGVQAARALLAEGVPGGVTVLEVGTAILDALPAFGEAGRIIVLDAVEAGGAPGSVYRMPLAGARPAERIASLHGFDVTRVAALAGRTSPAEVMVVGVEPAFIGWSLELSPAAAGAIPAVLAEVRRLVAESDWEASDRAAEGVAVAAPD